MNEVDIEFLKMALNEAMDNCKNQSRYKIYKNLLLKLDNEKGEL